MELLLFLSALLTALTGAISGTRVQDPQQLASTSIVSTVEVTKVAVTRAAPAANRPVAEPMAQALHFFIAAQPARTIALFVERRRE